MKTETATIDLTKEVHAFNVRVGKLPLALSLNHDSDDEFQLNSMLVTWPYVTGTYPYHRDVDLGRLTPGVVPDASVLVRHTKRVWADSRVFVGSGWVAYVRQTPSGEAWLSISSRDAATADKVVSDLKRCAVAVADAPDVVDITFVYLARHGALRTSRSLPAAPWSAIGRNYGAAVQATADRLFAIAPDAMPTGRLMLMHGPPGTGKSTLIRSLATAWRSWCSTSVVLDPDMLFGSLSYLHDVMLHGDDNDSSDKWRLIVLEDCDELLSTSAKQASGQAMARLLNIADGMVGQGLRLLLCLTTNEPVRSLHPAVLRPGRCLLDLEVPRLSRTEARAWLGGAVPLHGGNDASLAELYALRDGTSLTPAVAAARHAVGQYL